MSRFRITNHVPESKKSLTPEKVEASTLTAASCRSASRRRTPRRRRRRARRRRRRRSRASRRGYGSLCLATELGQKVQGAGDDERAVGPCELEPEAPRSVRVEPTPPPARSGLPRAPRARPPAGSARSPTRSRRAPARAPTAPRASAPGRLSRRIEQTTTYSRSGSRGSSHPTPARLCAPSQISSGRSPRRSSRPGSATRSAACGSTGRPRNASAAATASARLLRAVTTTSPAPFSSASSRHSGSPSTTARARLHDRELLGGDLPPASRRARPCGRARRS